jgi:hypothetical protein
MRFNVRHTWVSFENEGLSLYENEGENEIPQL